MNADSTINGIPFEQFVMAAKAKENPDAIVKIWMFVLELNDLFLVASDGSKKSYSGRFDQKNFWLHIFTSCDKAQRYIDGTPNNTDFRIVQKNIGYVMDLLFGQRQSIIYGVCINESDRAINAQFNIPKEILRRLILSLRPELLNGITHIKGLNESKRLNTMVLDIDDARKAAYKFGRDEDYERLWQLALSFDDWYFIAKYRDKKEDIRPFIGMIDNVGWVLVFTDKAKVSEYAFLSGNRNFIDPSGKPVVIKMQIGKALNFLVSLKKMGVYGVRMNILNGWYSPINSIPDIIETINSKS